MPRKVVLSVAALLFLFPCRAPAHDIPNDVTVQAFVKAKGEHLDLLVRVPLKAMRDVNFPERGPGYLDLAPASAVLPEAATLWIANFIELYEDGTPLAKPQIVTTRVSLPSHPSFPSYDDPLPHVTLPPPSTLT